MGPDGEQTVIETERLRLRRWREDDLEEVARWFADPVFTRDLAGPQTRDEAAAMLVRMRGHWDEHGFGSFAVEDRASGLLIGRSGPAYHRAWPGDPEVGWWIAPELQGQGLATEAGAASIRYCFDQLGLKRVVSITTELNLASRRVMEKLGFQLLTVVDSEWGPLWVHALDRPAA